MTPTTTVNPIRTAGTPAEAKQSNQPTPLTLEQKVALGLVRVQDVKPPVRGDADKMLSVANGDMDIATEAAKPKVNGSFQVLADGRLAIIIPTPLMYQDGRDTKSALQRNYYIEDGEKTQIDGVLIHPDGETEIPVTFTLSTGFTLKASVRRVSA